MVDKESLDQGSNPNWRSWIGWLLAAIGLPSTLAVINWRTVARHPALAVGLLLLFTMLVSVIGLARQVWRLKYNTRVIDWISASLDRRATRFARRYREYLLADLRFIDLRGLGSRFYTPAISEVYVDVALRSRDPGEVSSSDLADKSTLPETGQRQILIDFLRQSNPALLAVLGAPGSGKTTLLRHAALELCKRSDRQRKIPILLYLRDHVKAIVEHPDIAIPGLLSTILTRYGLVEPPGWFEHRLRSGECVIFLDGLDEVASHEERQIVSEWVSLQVTRYFRNNFVITSRPLGYQTAPIAGAVVLQVLPFTVKQVTQFVHSWYLAIERHSTGVDDPDITQRAFLEANDLLSRLRASPSLHDLTVNPLLLTMIATVHRHQDALPGSRAELYAQICQVLLWRRQAAKKLMVEPRGDQKERVVRVLAYEMMQRKVRDLQTNEARLIIDRVLRQVSKVTTSDDFLDDAASSGLFVERENGVRGFAHLTFQEYLAAAHIKDKNLQSRLVDSVSDVWWREATLLYCASSDAGPIVEACLKADTITSLTLAFDCADDASELSLELRQRLEQLLAEGLARDAEQRRRELMAGVTVSRYLRHIVETDKGARICKFPVSVGIYQLFLDDLRIRGQVRTPDCRTEDWHRHANDAAVGIRESDATAFVEWVNGIVGGRSSYRLPTPSELEDLDVAAAISEQLDLDRYWFWTSPESADSRPQIRSLRCGGSPLLISEETLRRQFKMDCAGAPISLVLLPLLGQTEIVLAALHDIAPEISLPDTTSLFSDVRRKVLNLAFDLQASLVGELESLRRGLMIRVGDLTPFTVVPPSRRLAITQILAKYLGRNLAVLCDLAQSLDLNYDYMMGAARDLKLNFDMSNSSSRAQAIEYIVEHKVDLNLALNFARDRERALDLIQLIVDTRAEDLTVAEALNLNRDRFYGDVRSESQGHRFDIELFLAAAARPFYGRAITWTLSNAWDKVQYDRGVAFPHDLGMVFMQTMSTFVSADVSDVEVCQGSLADVIGVAVDDLRSQLRSLDNSGSWALELCETFQASIDRILEREELVTHISGRALRIQALCLAAEADEIDEVERGRNFRHIAAEVAWLERRHTGADPAVEVIVLAQA